MVVPLITDQEEKVVDKLADAWNEFMLLPVEHSDDQREFRTAIHACQSMILARVGRRQLSALEQER